MVGAVIVTHGNVGQAMAEAARSITGKLKALEVIAVEGSDAVEGTRDRLAAAIKKVDTGGGVIIFTDMFGGTPTNIALSALKEGSVDVLTGVNLPVILKFEHYRREKPLAELTLFLKDHGRKSIVLAGDMLKEKK